MFELLNINFAEICTVDVNVVWFYLKPENNELHLFT